MVSENHRLRGPAARRSREARRLAGTYARDAAKLDRPQRRRTVHVCRRELRRTDCGLYDAPGYALRCDLSCRCARTSGRAEDRYEKAARRNRAVRAEFALQIRTRANEFDGRA